MSRPTKLTVLAEQVVLPGRDELASAAIDVDLTTGKITAIRDVLEAEDGIETIRLPAGRALLPGLIDTDVHISQPAEEGFATGTRAALSGGVTTVVDAPDAQSTTLAGLEEKRKLAESEAECDVAFWGGIIPDNEAELVPLLTAGVKGFQCTLTTFDPTFPAVSEDELMRACDLLPDDTLIIVHAELGDSIPLGETPYGQLHVFVVIAFGLFSAEVVKRVFRNGFIFYGVIWVTAVLTIYFGFASSQPTPTFSFRGFDMSTWLATILSAPLAVMAAYDFSTSVPKDGILKLAAIGTAISMAAGFRKANEFSPLVYSNYLRTRPSQIEDDGMKLVLRLARAYPSLRFHVSPLSSASALTPLREAKESDKPVSNLTLSTAPHYLTFSDTTLPPRTFGQPLHIKSVKAHPPIRDITNLQQLTQALQDGDITDIVSSHAPTTPKAREGDYLTSLGGISSLGLTLPLLHSLGFSLPRIVDWMGIKQALKAGLQGRKGEIRVGADADFVIFNPDAEQTITESSLLFQHKHSPYLGRSVRGRVEATYLRGEKVFDTYGSSVKTGKGQVL